jgi:capsular polysaccharide export protein
MTAPSLVYPAEGAALVGIRPRNDRVRALMRGLAGGRGVRFLSHVWIDPRGAPLPAGVLDDAAVSAQKPGRGGLGTAVKRAVLRGQYNWSHRHLPPDPPLVVACWNGLKGHRRLAMEAARRNGHATLFLEEAPLPGRITADLAGVNAASSLPRLPDFYRHWLAGRPDMDPAAWRQIRAGLTPREATQRQDVHQRAGGPDLAARPYIFCPLQVPGDSQITVFGDWIASVEAMLDHVIAASASLPAGWQLRIKEHPSAKQSFAARIAAKSGRRVVLDNQTNTIDQVAGAHAVLTINSSVGFESLFFDKPVIVLGRAFYAIEGIATIAASRSALERSLARPADLGFDPGLRDAFMSYVTQVQFPREDAVAAGRYTLADIVARDRARDDLLTEIGAV